jgi:CheY-like chemotaxis protein
MPDILVLSAEVAFVEAISQTEGASSLRIKHTSSEDLAQKWSETRVFSSFIADPVLSLGIIKSTYQNIIEKSPCALCCVYSPTELELALTYDLNDIGLEVIVGKEELKCIFQTIDEGKERSQSSILIIDDLDTPREIVEMYLEQMGYAVTGAASAREALEVLSKEPEKFFCIITDLRMPEINGVELIKRVRADSKLAELPVIVLSAYGTGTLLFESLQAGASGFLTKPPRRGDIVRELGRARRVALGLESARLINDGKVDNIKEHLLRRGVLED